MTRRKHSGYPAAVAAVREVVVVVVEVDPNGSSG